MITLPLHPTLRIDRLAGVFKATTSTYKYYWLLALLDVVGEGRTKIPLRSVYLRMVSNAWYTVNYFKLSFGAWDSLQKAIEVLLAQEPLDARTSRSELEHVLLHTARMESVTALVGLGRYVPYKFLSPWLAASPSDALVMQRSQDPSFGTPYAIFGDHLVVPEQWAQYFIQHKFILRDFCLWNLAQFLQARNPNVPQVVNKLVKPPSRAALTKQRALWNAVLDHTGGLACIYTGMHLTSAGHHIEHFIPHAFVAHDQLWNLVPASQEFNLQKSDRLPRLCQHIEPFVEAHWQLLNVVRDQHISNKLLEDYDMALHLPHREIRDRYLFGDKLRDTIVPLHGIALSNGFAEVG
jgi:5-methylcytosine-specific restriction endonuclease McrA